MKLFDKIIRKNKLCSIFFYLLYFNCSVIFATNNIIPKYDEAQYQADISQIYQTILSVPHLSLPERIEKVSGIFLGKRYLRGALGEGKTGNIDKSPLYRTDAFDCETFVSTVIALAKSKNYSEFISLLKKINYKDGNISYFNRFHFTETDWNLYNQKQGILQDVTTVVSNNYRITHVWIDKPNWFRSLSSDNLKFFEHISNYQSQRLIQQLHVFSKRIKGEFSNIPYVPLTSLFSNKENTVVVNRDLLKRIPQGAVIEIVNKTIPKKDKIGTDLGVTHMGFAIHTSKGLLFRHASSIAHKVTDQDFISYFLKYYLSSKQPENIGFNIEKVI